MNHLLSTQPWRDATEIQRPGLAQYLADNVKLEDDEGQRPSQSLVVIVDKRALERECLARSLLEHAPALTISAVGSLDEFQKLPPESEASVILVILGGRRLTDQSVRAELTQFVTDVGTVPVIVVADSDEPAEILAALESGAKGFIPTSVKVRVAAEAIGLARAGEPLCRQTASWPCAKQFMHRLARSAR